LVERKFKFVSIDGDIKAEGTRLIISGKGNFPVDLLAWLNGGNTQGMI
jgi:hypothetical protein